MLSKSVLYLKAAVILALARLTAGGFVFEFQLSSINTHVNCFGDDLTIPCETYLSIFCLRRSSETSGCSLGSSGQHGPGGSLPITRQIPSSSSWPVSFQLFIRARDEDNPGIDDDLDDIFINQSREPTTGYTQPMEYFGIGRRVSVILRYRVLCQDNFYGTDCATYCLAQDDNTNGHYTCNSDGSIQCRSGFENPSNNCRDRITACSVSPCQQEALCTPIGLTDYTCDCPDGFTGKSCEININECDPNPCQHNGTCTDLINDHMCWCPAGYSGKNCSIDIDDCDGVKCRGNSTCVDGVDSFTCVCNLGFEGENCTEINPCDLNPCANEGGCVPLDPFTYTCQCSAGYTGLTKCVDDIDSYSCVCNPGFVGEQCMPEKQASTTTDDPMMTPQSAQLNITTAIIGAVIGVIVIVLTIVIIIIVLLVILNKGRTKQPIYSLPDELLATSKTARADSHIYQSHEDYKPGSSTAPNPLYNSPEHKSGVSSSAADPYYSCVPTLPSDKSPSSTLHVVSNPVYGSPSPPHNAEAIYTLPKPQTSTNEKKTAGEENPYSYARVEVSRMSLKSSSGSVIRTDQQVSQPLPPNYEYIKMAPAEAARPDVEIEPTVTLSPNSGANGQAKIVIKRSIYDDNFQYEVVNTKSPSGPMESSNTSESHHSSPQSSHYDVPRSTGSLEKPSEPLTPTYGNILCHPPYDKLHHGTDSTQQTNFVRLGKIEGSGYEILNSN